MANLKLDIEPATELFYVDARFDVPESGSFMKDPYVDLKILDTFVLKFGSIKKRILGFEISHKAKKPHYHIRYEIVRNSNRVPATFGSAFTYYFRKLDKPPLTKGGHMVKKLDKLDSHDAFFQYCLKQQTDFSDIEVPLIKGFSQEQLLILWTKAVENQRIAVARYQKEEKKKNSEVLEYAKLSDYLDKMVLPHIIEQNEVNSIDGFHRGSYNQIAKHLGILIIQYYQLNHDSKMPTSNKLLSTIHRYMSKNKILTPENLCELILKL